MLKPYPAVRGASAILVSVVLMGLFYAFVHTPANATTAFRPDLALIARVVGSLDTVRRTG